MEGIRHPGGGAGKAPEKATFEQKLVQEGRAGLWDGVLSGGPKVLRPWGGPEGHEGLEVGGEVRGRGRDSPAGWAPELAGLLPPEPPRLHLPTAPPGWA